MAFNIEFSAMERMFFHTHITHTDSIPFPFPNPFDTQPYHMPQAMQQPYYIPPAPMMQQISYGASINLSHQIHHAYAPMNTISFSASPYQSFDPPPMAYVDQGMQLIPPGYQGVPVRMHSDNSRTNYDNLVNYYQEILQGLQVPYPGINNSRPLSQEEQRDLILRSREEAISRELKTRIYNGDPEGNANKDGGHGDVCTICLDEYEDNCRIGTLQCRHEYHVDCIKKWLLKSTTCPVCRAPALSIDRRS